MLNQIQGLHHVTALASSASANNSFFTDVMGLRRVKKTVNFDAPHVYHLYYGDERGSPGTVMTYFPFPASKRGAAGAGEVGSTNFAIRAQGLDFWAQRLADRGVADLARDTFFGAPRLTFTGPDGEKLALIETADDERAPWHSPDIPDTAALHGFHSTSLRLNDIAPEVELLRFMGYETVETDGEITRMALPHRRTAHIIDLEAQPSAPAAQSGAGTVHHVAFAVETRARQLEVREALLDTGYQVTPVIDRDYFHAIYFRTPGGILFEVATNEPGFARDEPCDHLGEALKLPAQHEHLRQKLERRLEPLPD